MLLTLFGLILMFLPRCCCATWALLLLLKPASGGGVRDSRLICGPFCSICAYRFRKAFIFRFSLLSLPLEFTSRLCILFYSFSVELAPATNMVLMVTASISLSPLTLSIWLSFFCCIESGRTDCVPVYSDPRPM